MSYDDSHHVGCIINGSTYWMFNEGLRAEGMFERTSPMQRRRVRQFLREGKTVRFMGHIICPINEKVIEVVT